VQALGSAAVVPDFAGAVLAAPLKSITVPPPAALNCPPDNVLVPIQLFAPASVGKPLVSAVGLFQVFVAPQYQRSWFVVSTYRAGGAHPPAGAPAPAVMAPAAEPVICDQTPGVPVTVQK